MKRTLLLRLAGPMQAWGLQSRFSIRDTAREPTKSGVLGLVCAALGRPREAPLDDLAALPMGVRVDREGQLRHDFHTAMNVLIASTPLARLEKGKPGKLKHTEPSTRYYLADAWFTVGLESEDQALLERIDTALERPRWPLFLGRKAFLPSLPVRVVNGSGQPIGLVNQSLVEAMAGFVDPCWRGVTPVSPRFVVEAGTGDALDVVARRMQPDHPVSFQPRRYLPREVIVGYLST